MQHLTCDKTGVDLAEPEATVLRISGPLRSMLDGRRVIHLGKAPAAALCRWLGHDLNRPELEALEGPEPAPTAVPNGG